MTEHKSSLPHLFNIVAQDISKSASVRYVIHKDHAAGKWNVFKKTGLREEFIQDFTALDDAQDFCDINNGVPQRGEA